MMYLQIVAEIDHTVPLWGLLTVTVICIIFVVNMHMEIKELKNRVNHHEARLQDGAREIKQMGADIHLMRNMLTKINTKLNFVLKVNDDEDK